MIADLQAQLKFVQAIQQVDTEGVEPLQSIRDETCEGEAAAEIGLAEMKGELEKEMVVGMTGRIVRKKVVREKELEEGGKWDPLEQAPRKLGRFFVVDTAKD